MDAKLAEIYGTGKVDEADVETLAAAQLATKLAAAEEVDVAGLSDDEAEALAAQVIGETEEQSSDEDAEEEVETEEGEKTAEDEEAQEKIAEADYIGRVMAHAYVAERMELEKQAGKVSNFLSAAKDVATGKQARQGYAAMRKSKATARSAKALSGNKHLSGSTRAAAGKKVGKHTSDAKAHGKSALRGAAKTVGMYGGAAAVGGGAAAAMKKKESAVQDEEQLSALDQLALARAREILAENNISLEEETEKTSALNEEQAELLQAKVNERAVALLEANGYTFSDSDEETTEE